MNLFSTQTFKFESLLVLLNMFVSKNKIYIHISFDNGIVFWETNEILHSIFECDVNFRKQFWVRCKEKMSWKGFFTSGYHLLSTRLDCTVAVSYRWGSGVRTEDVVTDCVAAVWISLLNASKYDSLLGSGWLLRMKVIFSCNKITLWVFSKLLLNKCIFPMSAWQLCLQRGWFAR